MLGKLLNFPGKIYVSEIFANERSPENFLQMVNVLVVEDEGLVGLSLQKQLTNAGYHVPAVAVSAEEALLLIELQKPDLVLMDVRIRGARDGIEAAEMIRKISQIPIIFVSALADKDTLARASRTRPSGYMVKPLSLLSLTSSIEMALHNYSAQTPREIPATGIEFQRQTMDYLAAFMEALPSPSALLAAQGQVIFSNSQIEELLGYEKAELAGRPIESLRIQSAGGGALLDSAAILKASEAGRQDLPGDFSVASKRGARLLVDVALSPIELANGRFVLLSILDNSEQREARQISQMFESLVKSVKDYAIFMLSPEGVVLSWNEGAQRIKGYQAHEIVGKHFSCFYSQEDIQRGHPDHELRSALANGKFAEEGWRFRRDGSRFWASVIITPVWSEDGHHLGFSKVTHDITERKAAELALQSSEREFRLLADAIPHIVWMTGSDGRSLYRNRRWSEFSSPRNPPAQAALQQDESWTNLLHPDETAGARASWQTAISAQIPTEGEYRLWDSQRREYRWHLARALPVRNENGDLTRWFGTLTDIHGHKAAAEELELEVRKRTAALSDSLKQLRAKEEILRQSLIEKDVLLREIHHRVKNNLQIVSSLLNMQASNLEDSLAVAKLRDSERRVLSMALIHEQLYGNKTMSSIDFSEYVGQLVARVFATFAHNRVVCYRLNLEPTTLTIDHAIPCGLILNELVTNALKYAYPHGDGGEVYVGLSCDAHNVTMKVSDQGVGFPTAFDPAKSKTLGLQIIRILTKQIGGTLNIDHSAGASFTMRFPHEVRH